MVAKKLGLTQKSRHRDRRPTLDELDRLMTHFLERSTRRPSSVPMHRVMAFAIFSTRRQEEITRIKWANLDQDGKRILVRDMKNPGEKIGNDVWCDLPDPALAIIEAMPKNSDRIFPYSSDAISASFTRANQFLDIKDLRFHDLRHEGVSRLFEIGYNVAHAAAVSGHRSWVSLKRYTHLRQTGDKYESWSWTTEVTAHDPKQRKRRPVRRPAIAAIRTKSARKRGKYSFKIDPHIIVLNILLSFYTWRLLVHSSPLTAVDLCDLRLKKLQRIERLHHRSGHRLVRKHSWLRGLATHASCGWSKA
ncbi:tyrosine-type recombinase/integrase [Roseovarius carneus]|uniref:tyrosine-type recombinase/integrase n=1 Tax=Roseovarius carneus TaxID=2853164 RepID=UPI001CC9B4EA|nr:tyrosine-type recombinase/integrase [Roseovarius carneus]